MKWYLIATTPPPTDVVLNFKIDDTDGVRNERPLIKKGNLYWHTDGSMYVYYTPTHWSY
jgi:hypothetical protein